MLHRDLKSPNILLDKQFRAKVCDFGLTRVMRVARAHIVHSPFTGTTRLLPADIPIDINSFPLRVSEPSSALSSETTVSIEDRNGHMTKAAGTTRWMAPEVFRGDRIYGRAVDVYSFGMVMWELTTLRTPWMELEGDGEYDGVEFFKKLNRALQTNRRPTIPAVVALNYPHYVAVMQQCWEGDPADRPPFSLVVNELAACLREMPL